MNYDILVSSSSIKILTEDFILSGQLTSSALNFYELSIFLKKNQAWYMSFLLVNHYIKHLAAQYTNYTMSMSVYKP